MALKDLTAEKHRAAESTPFMKAVFARTLPLNLWIDWTYQKWLFYQTIEHLASKHNLLADLPDLPRSFYLNMDFQFMKEEGTEYKFHASTLDYYYYLKSIGDDPNKIMAHVYTWHMGDLFGGQMIKKIVAGSHRSLDFEDPETLKINIRKKLNDSMADEANIAFDWAIKMMSEYDSSLG